MSATALWGALRARYDAAFAAAAAAVPGLVRLDGDGNKRRVELDPLSSYFRPHTREIGARRVGAGSPAVEVQKGIAFVDLLLVLEAGDDGALAMFDAIRPSFLTGADGLEFEEAPSLRAGRADGSHWMAVATFPWQWKELAAA